MNQTYKCLKNNFFQINNFSLIPIRQKDIEQIRLWRNDQIKILRQNELISKENQIKYFEKNIWPLFDKNYPEQLIFSYLKDEELIGYGGLVHINWIDKKAEISFLLDTKYISNTIIHDLFFNEYLKLIQLVGFDDLKLHKLYAEIYDTRPHHIEILKKNDFLIDGILRDHVLIENKYINSIICSKLIIE